MMSTNGKTPSVFEMPKGCLPVIRFWDEIMAPVFERYHALAVQTSSVRPMAITLLGRGPAPRVVDHANGGRVAREFYEVVRAATGR